MSPNVPASRKLYALLKADIARGRFAPGAQLPLADLAGELGTSVQPVRDVLARLVGERMLTFHPRAGFQVPVLKRREIRDLVDWHAHLLRMILRERRLDWALPDMSDCFSNLDETDPIKVAQLAATLFSAIAKASENIEHVEAIKSASARLHPIWIRDSASAATAHELQMIAAATTSGSQSAIKGAIWAYQRRQQRRIRYVQFD